MYPFIVFAPCSFSVGEVRFLKPGLWLYIPFGFNLGPSWSIQSSCGYLRGITKVEESHLRCQIQPHTLLVFTKERTLPGMYFSWDFDSGMLLEALGNPTKPLHKLCKRKEFLGNSGCLTLLPSTQPTRLYTATSPFLGVRLLNSHSKLHPKDVVSSQISRGNTLHNSCLWTWRGLQPPARWEGDQTGRLSVWTALGAKLFEAAGLNELSVYVIRGRFPPFLRFIQHRAPAEEQGVQTEILNEVLLQLKSLKDLRDHRNLKD